MMNDAIHLYTIDLNATPDELERCRSLLSADELLRADKFVFDRHRRRWTVSRARLRQVLAQHLRIDTGTISFAAEPFGKPVLPPDLTTPGQPGQLHFNVSHSHELALIAVTELGALGVDIEFQRSVTDWQAVASRYFSVAEQRALHRFETGERMHAFYCCWTRKEAVIKATGEGLSARLDAFDVSLANHPQPQVRFYQGSNPDISQWQLFHLEPRPGYVGAIALHHPVPACVVSHTTAF